MVDKRIIQLKKDIILEDDISMVKKMIKLLG
jgi:hypothetical protein